MSPFNPLEDMPIIEEWLYSHQVARWWGEPSESIDAVRDHDISTSAIIVVDRMPIGYLCWQKPTHEELVDAGLSDLPPGLIDIDIVIGESAVLGRGYGTEALSQLLSRLGDEGVQFVGIATAEANTRARKAFEKVGFRLFRTFTEQGERMLYLTKTLSTAA